MATWGGSTVDNMESITEDGVDGNQASDNDEVDDGEQNRGPGNKVSVDMAKGSEDGDLGQKL